MNEPCRQIFFHLLTLHFHHYKARFEDIRERFYEERRLVLKELHPGKKFTDVRKYNPYPKARISDATLLLVPEWRISRTHFMFKATGDEQFKSDRLLPNAKKKYTKTSFQPRRYGIPDWEYDLCIKYEEEFYALRIEAKALWRARGYVQRVPYPDDDDDFMNTMRSLSSDELGGTPLPFLEDWYERSHASA